MQAESSQGIGFKSCADFKTKTIFQGWLKKRGQRCKSWRKRWVVLNAEKQQISYYVDEGRTRLKGTIDLATAHWQDVGADPKHPSRFIIQCPDRTWRFEAASKPVRKSWVELLVYVLKSARFRRYEKSRVKICIGRETDEHVKPSMLITERDCTVMEPDTVKVPSMQSGHAVLDVSSAENDCGEAFGSGVHTTHLHPRKYSSSRNSSCSSESTISSRNNSSTTMNTGHVRVTQSAKEQKAVESEKKEDPKLVEKKAIEAEEEKPKKKEEEVVESKPVEKKESTPAEPVKKKKKKGKKIGALAAGLNLNPGMFRPGAGPPKKKKKATAPAEPQQNVAANKATIKTKRKRRGKKGKRAALLDLGDDSVPAPKKMSKNVEVSTETREPKQPKQKDTKSVEPEKRKEKPPDAAVRKNSEIARDRKQETEANESKEEEDDFIDVYELTGRPRSGHMSPSDPYILSWAHGAGVVLTDTREQVEPGMTREGDDTVMGPARVEVPMEIPETAPVKPGTHVQVNDNTVLINAQRLSMV